MSKEATQPIVPGSAAPIGPRPTTEDLARQIQALDTTLSEVLVLLYHVVQANESLIEAVRHQRPAPAPPVAGRAADLRSHLYAIIEPSTGQ